MLCYIEKNEKKKAKKSQKSGVYLMHNTSIVVNEQRRA